MEPSNCLLNVLNCMTCSKPPLFWKIGFVRSWLISTEKHWESNCLLNTLNYFTFCAAKETDQQLKNLLKATWLSYEKAKNVQYRMNGSKHYLLNNKWTKGLISVIQNALSSIKQFSQMSFNSLPCFFYYPLCTHCLVQEFWRFRLVFTGDRNISSNI